MTQRPIKFRAWEHENKVMVYDAQDCRGVYECDWCFENYLWHINRAIELGKEPGYTLMQFTGLHDKNGKEIWEGDVVKNQTVEGVPRERIIRNYVEDTHWLLSDMRGPADFDFEVIGNIYENPELINQP